MVFPTNVLIYAESKFGAVEADSNARTGLSAELDSLGNAIYQVELVPGKWNKYRITSKST